MTQFYCITCSKIFDDIELKWWDNKQVCARCFDKYKRLTPNDMGIRKNRQ